MPQGRVSAVQWGVPEPQGTESCLFLPNGCFLNPALVGYPLLSCVSPSQELLLLCLVSGCSAPARFTCLLCNARLFLTGE